MTEETVHSHLSSGVGDGGGAGVSEWENGSVSVVVVESGRGKRYQAMSEMAGEVRGSVHSVFEYL